MQSRQGSSSTGAIWVAGLGAFLLVAAAATFVAVRWDDIPQGAKFASLVAVTGACLVAQRQMRRALLLTSAVLFHLGVLLVPVDVAALGMRAGWDWPLMLFAQGATATIVFGFGAISRDSVVLRVTTWAGIVLLAAGTSALTDAPAGLVLAAIALVAVLSRRHEVELGAIGWALLAGLAVPLSGAEELSITGSGVLADLGLTNVPSFLAPAAIGLLAGVSLAAVAGRRRNVPIALVGIACVFTGAVTAWTERYPAKSSVETDWESALLAFAALCLLAELAAWIWRTDNFWSKPTGILAGTGEVLAGGVCVGLVSVLLVPSEDPLGRAGLGAAIVGLVWVVSIARRPLASTSDPVMVCGPLAAVVAFSAAAGLMSGSPIATGGALSVSGSIVLLSIPVLPSASRAGALLTVGCLAWAPALAGDSEWIVATTALGGALVIAASIVHISAREVEPLIKTLALSLVPTSLAPLASGALRIAQESDVAGVVLALAGVWLVAAVLDIAARNFAVPLADRYVLTVRCAALVPILATLAVPSLEAAIIAGAAAALATIDAVRLRQPVLLLGAGCATPIAVAAVAMASGANWPQAGLAVATSSLVWGVLAAKFKDTPWAMPTQVSTALAGTAGLVLAAEDAAVLANALLVIGGAAVVMGIAWAHRPRIVVGATMATVGTWIHLALADVASSESYLAPVAIIAVIVGSWTRERSEVSSWLAFVPAIALLGGSALAERLAGGADWHGLIAGAVGLVAVGAGAAWRQAGPLFVGTALLVAVTVHETLAVTAKIPTWTWLAVGGTLLLSAGIAMERRDTGPIETGRRLVDLVSEQFD